jgi:hypothetical protein
VLAQTDLYDIYGVREPRGALTPLPAATRHPNRFIDALQKFLAGRLPAHWIPEDFILVRALEDTPGQVEELASLGETLPDLSNEQVDLWLKYLANSQDDSVDPPAADTLHVPTSAPAQPPVFASVYERFEFAYVTYVSLLQQASAEYMRALQGAPGGPMPLQTEAYADYVRQLQEVRKSTREKFEDAYRNYLKALREAWLNVDVQDMDPGVLSMIGQSIAMAKLAADGSLGAPI